MASETYEHVIPTKQIKSVMDMPKWEKSQAYHVKRSNHLLFPGKIIKTIFQEYLGFIQTIGTAISGKRITDEKIVKSESVLTLVKILDSLSSWIDEIKLAEQQQRFGNVAFREWHSRLLEVKNGSFLAPFYHFYFLRNPRNFSRI